MNGNSKQDNDTSVIFFIYELTWLIMMLIQSAIVRVDDKYIAECRSSFSQYCPVLIPMSSFSL
jgi:hypothetical protein